MASIKAHKRQPEARYNPFSAPPNTQGLNKFFQPKSKATSSTTKPSASTANSTTTTTTTSACSSSSSKSNANVSTNKITHMFVKKQPSTKSKFASSSNANNIRGVVGKIQKKEVVVKPKKQEVVDIVELSD